MDPHVLLDARGIVLQHLHSGRDADANTDSLTGRPVNTPGYALDNLITDVLLPVFQQVRVKQVLAVWDGGNVYREEKSGGKYKAQRKAREASPEMTEAVKGAQVAARALLKALGVTQLHVPDVEADDVIAWLVDGLPGNKLIYTVDRDLLQLAAPRPDKGVAVCVRRDWPEAFVDKGVEVPFERVALYKSLVGDSSDNYVGVKGFGPKAWQKLEESYGPEIFALLQDAITGAGMGGLRQFNTDPILAKLVGAYPEWKASWDLACLHPELVNQKREKGRKFNRPKWLARVPSAERTAEVLAKYGCSHHLPALLPYLPSQHLITAADSTVDEILEDAKLLIAESPFISIDWETAAPPHEPFVQASRGRDYVDMLRSRLTGVGLTMGRDLQHTFYLSVGHANTQNLPADLIPKIMDLIPADKPKVVQNFYFECAVYKAQFGQTLLGCHDTKIMANHVEESESSGLKDLSKRLLNYDQIKYREVIEKGKTMADYSAEHVFQYGADDPLVTAHLYELLKLRCQLEGTWDFLREYEFTAVYPLVDAYLQGVNVDWDELRRQGEEDEATFAQCMARLRELLRTHQDEATFEAGLQNLMDVEVEVLEARREQGEISEEEALEAKGKLRLTLEDRVRYADYEEERRTPTIPLTPRWVAQVCEKLHLPLPPEKFTKGAVEAWESAVRETVPGSLEARIFAQMLNENRTNLHVAVAKAPPERERMRRFCEQVLKEDLPVKVVKKGSELSLDSPPQMRALLYGMLVLPVRTRAFEPTEVREELNLEGAVQANEDAIASALAYDAPPGSWKREALECLLRARKAHTRLKMFYRNYPLWVHPATGRVHAQINSVGTETRRMSGSSPNLMQLPKRNEGVKFRRCILPSPGHDLIVSIDFAGEELRVAAGLSRDPAMLGCYIDREILADLPEDKQALLSPMLRHQLSQGILKDLHSLTGAGILDMSYDEFEAARHDDSHPRYADVKLARAEGKTVNFGAQYGIGAAKLARQMLVTAETAKAYLEAKRNVYQVFESWRAEETARLHRQGYLRTLYGSMRHVYDKLFDKDLLSYYERAAINFLIQGLCADYLKVVLTDIYRSGVLERHGVHLLAPIHDELVFSLPAAVAEPFILEVHALMVQGIPGLPCPIWAEPSLGPNFGTQYELGAWPTSEGIADAVREALGGQKVAA